MEKREIVLFMILIFLFFIVALKIGRLIFNFEFFAVYSFLATAYLLSSFALSRRYNPLSYNETDILPQVSVIVTCYNEEQVIGKCLRSLKEQSYPKDLLEIIVVNDGSTDNSLNKILEEAEGVSYVKVINFPRNKGKREALATGIRAASGTIVVTVDGDTVLDKKAVRNIVQPFTDSEVVGACGRIKILNSDKNIITKMQVVYYWLGSQILKSVESLTGNVLCLSGCLNAFRRDVVLSFLDDFVNQTFLGAKPVAGDDRSLTNFLLRRGKTVYASLAVAYTKVPEDFITLLKQQVRWKRSYVRESFIAAKFMWKKHPVASLRFYTSLFLTYTCPIAFLRLCIIYAGSWLLLPMFLGYLLAPILAVIYYRSVENTSQLHYLVFGILWILVFVWLLPYALVTVRSRKWMTR
jgi:hyaluronan synthase